jgi:SAM-dependent methyltransferase
MGMNLNALLHLQARGLLRPGAARLLDVGPQNIYFATEAQIRAFVRHQGQKVSDARLETEIARLVRQSTPREGEHFTFLSEICDLTPIAYASIDVAPALKTTALDLNFDRLPERMRGVFDLVLNFGTTEHVFNQWNSFAQIHEAAKPGGVIYCQLPASGYLDHGYFCYTPVFFRDLAKANGYEIADQFFTLAGRNDFEAMAADVRRDDDYGTPNSDPDGRLMVPCFNINAVMVKGARQPFRALLEVATAANNVKPSIALRYGGVSVSAQARNAAEYYARRWLGPLLRARRALLGPRRVAP